MQRRAQPDTDSLLEVFQWVQAQSCWLFSNNFSYLSQIFWILKPRKMSLEGWGLGWEVSKSFPCFCSFLNVNPCHGAVFQTAGLWQIYVKPIHFFPSQFFLLNFRNIFSKNSFLRVLIALTPNCGMPSCSLILTSTWPATDF